VQKQFPVQLLNFEKKARVLRLFKFEKKERKNDPEKTEKIPFIVQRRSKKM
jgi:hypothetical protein